MIAFAQLGQGDKAAELFSLLNPINRATTRADVHRYKVEPYVVAADVYSVAPHAGRGGWTWYTGSAGWMYRAGLEGILGFRVQGSSLRRRPLHSRALARLRDHLHVSRHDLRDRGRESGRRQPRHQPRGTRRCATRRAPDDGGAGR